MAFKDVVKGTAGKIALAVATVGAGFGAVYAIGKKNKNTQEETACDASEIEMEVADEVEVAE